jgi:hypothetical protein
VPSVGKDRSLASSGCDYVRMADIVDCAHCGKFEIGHGARDRLRSVPQVPQAVRTTIQRKIDEKRKREKVFVVGRKFVEEALLAETEKQPLG